MVALLAHIYDPAMQIYIVITRKVYVGSKLRNT